jgi:hypothetical protein
MPKEALMLKSIICVAAAPILFSTLAFAANPHTGGTTGQPNCSCESTPSPPGNASEARGSAFSPTGIAGTHYAGEQPQNSKNPKSVSQYDVACFQQTQRLNR